MRFRKMHGLGNDFILVDALGDADLARNAESAAPLLCSRTLGIGSDGVLFAIPSERADFEMVMVNPDGSRGMCGNGLRCFARFLRSTGRAPSDEIRLDTPNGVTLAKLLPSDDPSRGDVQVEMGRPGLRREQIPMVGAKGERVVDEPLSVDGTEFRVTCVSMGNPHCVIFVEDPEAVDLATLGPAIEHHPAFPERTNVHFVGVSNPGELVLRVWERGAGATQACGSGSCAVAVAGVLTGKTRRRAVVHNPGGDLEIDWRADDDMVLMTGPTEYVFDGEIDLDHLAG
jgi:diaminopimelate epimerase